MQQPISAGVMLACPSFETGRVDQQAQNLRETGFLIVKADKAGKPLLWLDIRVRDAALEQIIEEGFVVTASSSRLRGRTLDRRPSRRDRRRDSRRSAAQGLLTR